MTDKFDLIESLDNYIVEEAMAKSKIAPPRVIHYYPSEASVEIIDSFGDKVVHGGCLRQTYYRCTGIDGKETTPAQQWVFALGNAVEKMITNKAKKAGVWVGNNVKFYDEVRNISGEVDLVVKDPMGKLVGIEIKSYYGYYAEKEIEGSRQKAGMPKMNQFIQTLIYADQFRDSIDYFQMYYMHRGFGRRKGYFVEALPDELEDGTIIHRPMLNGKPIMSFTMEDIYKRVEILDDCIKNNILPPRDFEQYYDDKRIAKDYKNKKLAKNKYDAFKKKGERPGDWNCSYCAYSTLCAKAEETK